MSTNPNRSKECQKTGGRVVALRTSQWPKWLILPALLLCSCTGLLTQKTPPDQKDPGHALTGLHYHLPKARVKITGTPSSDPKKPYIVAITRDMVADKETRYRLHQRGSAFHDDHLIYKVNKAGLIDTDLTATSESKIKDIVVNVVETGLNVVQMKLKKGGKGTMNLDTVDTPAKPKPMEPFEVNFDPYVKAEISAATTVMKQAGFVLETAGLRREGKWPAQRPYRSLETGEVTSSSEGIYYRPSTTVRVRVSMIEGPQNLLLNEEVSVPDKDDVAVFRLPRGLFGKTNHVVTFSNGEITKMVLDHKSEGVGLTAIPLAVTQKILDTAAALPAVANFFWKPKPDPNADIKKQTAQLQAEKARLDQENELLKLAQQNEELRKKMPARPAGSRFGSGGGSAGGDELSNLRRDKAASDQRVRDLEIENSRLRGGNSELPLPLLPPVPTEGAPVVTPNPEAKPKGA